MSSRTPHARIRGQTLRYLTAVTLGVATVEESVTVSGASPVVDTSTTRLQTNYDRETLASLPNARDMWSLLGATPSVALTRVDVGGSTAGTQTTYFAYGFFGQNRPLIEGINTLAEPIGTRRQDNIVVLDFRVEKQIPFAVRGKLGLFLDLFNSLNADTAVNINWRSGASFEKATTVLGPRIAKVCLKMDW